MLRRYLLLAPLVPALACGDGDLTVRLTLDHDELVGVQITAIPFDPDAILDSLATAAGPAPTFATLEDALFEFRPSDDSALAAINGPWLALRDSVAGISHDLERMDRHDPAYAVAYERFRELYAQFTRRTAQRDRELTELDGNAVELARWAQAAADTLRAWERRVFTPYDSLASAALAGSGHELRTVNTDTHGKGRLELPAGDWWLIVKIPDAANPFLEYYWNVPVRVNGLVPTMLTLTERHAHHRWRH